MKSLIIYDSELKAQEGYDASCLKIKEDEGFDSYHFYNKCLTTVCILSDDDKIWMNQITHCCIKTVQDANRLSMMDFGIFYFDHGSSFTGEIINKVRSAEAVISHNKKLGFI